MSRDKIDVNEFIDSKGDGVGNSEIMNVLADIDYYESYCRDHPDYKNNRAVFAIANIGKCYTERLEKHDFLT